MGTPDSREYDRLKARKFQPYSKGHQMMYEVAINGMRDVRRPPRVFEAGFGIGWGLDRMVEENVFAEYVGCEPNHASFTYTHSRHGARKNVHLIHTPFSREIVTRTPPFDHTVCIEVIEHVPLQNHLAFLRDLRMLAPTLWFSTPDIDKVPREGVRKTREWVGLLRDAGFGKIDVNTEHWTYLYRCEVGDAGL